MATSTNWLLRQYRWLLPRRGSLARRWDRIEAAVALAVLVLAVLAVPTAVLAGTGMHERQAVVAAAQQAERSQAGAVLLAPTPPQAVGDASASPVTHKVPAQWQLPGGDVRTGTIEAGPGLDAGSSVPIWLDRAGNPVGPPMSDLNVLGLSIAFGALVWGALMVAGLLVYWGTRAILDRVRAAEWAHEWETARWRPRSKGDSK